MKPAFSLVVVLGLLSTGAAARDRLTNGPPRMPDNPNRMICQTESTTGTRLSETKRCLTAAQWYYLERDQRLALERVQAGKRLTGF